VKSRLVSVALCLCASAPAAFAAEATNPNAPAAGRSVKASFAPALQTPDAHVHAPALVFTSPPRESPAEGQAMYAPIARYLGKTIGRNVVYRHPGTWGAYRSEMLRGDYDIVFDGPHFIGYRAERLQHNALAKLPGRHEFAIVTRRGEKFTTAAQMGGRTFCAHAPPNLGTLLLMSQFDNPARQPAIMPTEGWDRIYAGVIAGRCAGAVLPTAILQTLDTRHELKIVFRSEPLPNQGFSAGPRLSPAEQAKLVAALLAPEAAAPLAKLRAAFKVNEQLVAADNREYAGLGRLLRNEFGYY
jgi:ABC-type phosphate/phosphonate transport system substrate-binding protein